MYNETKKACNDRYLQKFKQVTLRLLPEELDRVKAAAETAGERVAPYIMQAVQDRMQGGQGLPDDLRRDVQAAAEAAGEDAMQWLRRAVNDTATRDKYAKLLKR